MNWIKMGLLAALWMFASSAVHAADFDFDPDAQEQLGTISLSVAALRDDPISARLRFADEVPDDVRALILGDLRLLAGIRGEGATPLHLRLFGGPVDGRLYLEWFLSRIGHIEATGCPGGSHANACYFSHRQLFFNESSLPRFRSMDSWRRLAVLMHEARHYHGIFHLASCRSEEALARLPGDRLPAPAGELESRDCDGSVEGPYAVSAMLMANIAKYCSNCSEEQRTDALRAGRFPATRVVTIAARRQLNEDLVEWDLQRR